MDPLADEKVEFLTAAGREKTVDFPCYADRYPIELLEYLRLMQMTPEDSRYVADFHLCLVKYCDSMYTKRITLTIFVNPAESLLQNLTLHDQFLPQTKQLS